MTNHLYNSG